MNFKLGTWTHITEICNDLQPESSGCLFKSPIAGDVGHFVPPPLAQAAQLVLEVSC